MAFSVAQITTASVAVLSLFAHEVPSREDESFRETVSVPIALDASAEPPARTAAFLPPPADDTPAFDDLPWSTGPEIGTGIAMKDTGDPEANSIFIGYAGYNVPLADAEAWVTALYDTWLRERGVRYVWAVRGPDDSHYEHHELGNTKIAARLCALAPAATFIMVAAHSSGSCSAHELFKQLDEGRDPEAATANKIVYFNLDGIDEGLTPARVARLKRAYFVGAVDRVTRTTSPNDADMRRLAVAYPGAGGYIAHDASHSGCAGDASWCLHVTLVTKHPHDPRAARGHLDYTDFSEGGVETAFFDEKAGEAGLAW
jgi:hypothetical protein